MLAQGISRIYHTPIYQNDLTVSRKFDLAEYQDLRDMRRRLPHSQYAGLPRHM